MSTPSHVQSIWCCAAYSQEWFQDVEWAAFVPAFFFHRPDPRTHLQANQPLRAHLLSHARHLNLFLFGNSCLRQNRLLATNSMVFLERRFQYSIAFSLRDQPDACACCDHELRLHMTVRRILQIQKQLAMRGCCENS